MQECSAEESASIEKELELGVSRDNAAELATGSRRRALATGSRRRAITGRSWRGSCTTEWRRDIVAAEMVKLDVESWSSAARPTVECASRRRALVSAAEQRCEGGFARTPETSKQTLKGGLAPEVRACPVMPGSHRHARRGGIVELRTATLPSRCTAGMTRPRVTSSARRTT